jgi:ATPase subunit of ABC transporter with duplicated ATPase domains
MTAVMLAAFTLTVFRMYVDSGSSKTEIMLVINIFQMMLMPLNMLPWALNGITRAKEARETLSKQLDTKEIILTKVVRDEKSKNVSVCIKPGSINCYGGSVSLKVQAMKLKKGKIYSVSGVHGSGKSTFLKSLAGLVSSNFACEIEGRVGYVDPTSFHLENSLCSVFNNLEIRETDVNNAELKRLMIGFHCLEIPLKNESSTFSGGEKLRLGLVRACLGRDVIIVDGNMNSLDSKVRGYVLHEMQLLAEREGKIFIVKE